jgi:transposase
MERKAYPSDVSDEEWAFVAPYLTLITEDAPQRVHDLRQETTGNNIQVAYVDAGYTGEAAAGAAEGEGIRLR